MTGQHAGDYVGKHRKPDPIGPTTDVLKRTFELFTHPQTTLNRHENKENKHG